MRRLRGPANRLRAVLAALALPLLLAAAPAPARAATETALFAGGCFWCLEADFEKLDGVVSAVSGYSGGHLENPTYEDSNTGTSGHAEAVEVVYDPAKVSYAQLVDYFWRHIDPLDGRGQFCDHGPQYRSAIFWRGDAQRTIAQASLIDVQKRFPQPVATELVEAGRFWPAEGYHQDYARNNPVRYRYYRFSCGRDARVEELWGDKAH